ncbi:uncharacterized protein LOC144149219 [Haemaphysalis longicornis]|uniref:Uncharacterized protein n=1 Tax=Haemaphysalis longicornis TaxID=44386 RepID=A0A9J6H9G2_HAELO|nr:hypothetical protein HPB48_025116 [Haemaphysalis longicornis]
MPTSCRRHHMAAAVCLSLAVSAVLASQAPQAPSLASPSRSAHLYARKEDSAARLDHVLNELGAASGNATAAFSLRYLAESSPFRSPLELGLIAAATAGALSMLFPLLMPGGGHAGSAERSEPHLQQQPADERTLLFRAGSGLAGFSEFVMTRVDKGLEKFPSIPSLDPQECMKRSVCEAHNQPNKYGLIGLALQLLYPPYSAPDEPTTVVSKYQLAARYGRQEDADCSRQYDGCIVSPLEIIQTIVSYFLR